MCCCAGHWQHLASGSAYTSITCAHDGVHGLYCAHLLPELCREVLLWPLASLFMHARRERVEMRSENPVPLVDSCSHKAGPSRILLWKVSLSANQHRWRHSFHAPKQLVTLLSRMLLTLTSQALLQLKGLHSTAQHRATHTVLQEINCCVQKA